MRFGPETPLEALERIRRQIILSLVEEPKSAHLRVVRVGNFACERGDAGRRTGPANTKGGRRYSGNLFE